MKLSLYLRAKPLSLLNSTSWIGLLCPARYVTTEDEPMENFKRLHRAAARKCSISEDPVRQKQIARPVQFLSGKHPFHQS